MGRGSVAEIVKHQGKWYLDIDGLAQQMESMMESAFEGMMMDEGMGAPGGGRPGGFGGGGGRNR